MNILDNINLIYERKRIINEIATRFIPPEKISGIAPQKIDEDNKYMITIDLSKWIKCNPQYISLCLDAYNRHILKKITDKSKKKLLYCLIAIQSNEKIKVIPDIDNMKKICNKEQTLILYYHNSFELDQFIIEEYYICAHFKNKMCVFNLQYCKDVLRYSLDPKIKYCKNIFNLNYELHEFLKKNNPVKYYLMGYYYDYIFDRYGKLSMPSFEKEMWDMIKFYNVYYETTLYTHDIHINFINNFFEEYKKLSDSMHDSFNKTINIYYNTPKKNIDKNLITIILKKIKEVISEQTKVMISSHEHKYYNEIKIISHNISSGTFKKGKKDIIAKSIKDLNEILGTDMSDSDLSTVTNIIIKNKQIYGKDNREEYKKSLKDNKLLQKLKLSFDYSNSINLRKYLKTLKEHVSVIEKLFNFTVTSNKQYQILSNCPDYNIHDYDYTYGDYIVATMC